MTQVVELAWSDIHAGHYIRWATPRFIKYGVVLGVHKQAMTVQLWEDLTEGPRPVNIPHAKWYFAQGKMFGLQAEESLFVIDELPITRVRSKPRQLPSEEQLITVQQACELIHMDPKQFRRHIRRGVIPATKNTNSQWVLDRSKLMEIANRYGWI